MLIANLDTYRGRFVAPVDFAAYLLVSPRVVYHWIAKGALRAVRIERTVRIPIEEARRFVKVPTTN
jgi:excisionase family DNA binding protein